MRVVFIRQAKGKSPEIAELVADYVRRLRPYCSAEILEPKSRGAGDDYNLPAIWNEPSTRRIALDERGKQFSSQELSKKISGWKDEPSIKTVCFFIGGPFGIPASVADSAHEKWSLSKGTLPQDLAWLVLVEQVYRGFAILAGHPYHHE